MIGQEKNYRTLYHQKYNLVEKPVIIFFFKLYIIVLVLPSGMIWENGIEIHIISYME